METSRVPSSSVAAITSIKVRPARVKRTQHRVGFAIIAYLQVLSGKPNKQQPASTGVIYGCSHGVGFCGPVRLEPNSGGFSTLLATAECPDTVDDEAGGELYVRFVVGSGLPCCGSGLEIENQFARVPCCSATDMLVDENQSVDCGLTFGETVGFSKNDGGSSGDQRQQDDDGSKFDEGEAGSC